jgi:hypothetical protein
LFGLAVADFVAEAVGAFHGVFHAFGIIAAFVVFG